MDTLNDYYVYEQSKYFTKDFNNIINIILMRLFRELYIILYDMSIRNNMDAFYIVLLVYIYIYCFQIQSSPTIVILIYQKLPHIIILHVWRN